MTNGTNNLRISCIIIFSLCSKLAYIKLLLQDEEIDILGIMETWHVSRIAHNLVETQGYDFLHIDHGLSIY